MGLIADFINLFFPECCLMCEESLVAGEKHFCLRCRFGLPVTNYHLDVDNPLNRKFAGKVMVKHSWAYLKFTKEGKVQHLIHQLKYHNKQEIGLLLGKWYGAELKAKNMHEDFDWLVPVPLHKSRLKKRGYNQCESIAKGLSEGMGIPYSTLFLQRIYANTTQTKLGRMERYENTKRIFQATHTELLRDKRILLVDDVITTGATLESCAHVMLQAGCKEVSVVCLAAAQ